VQCEDTKHVFFECPRVVEVWESLGLSPIINEACLSDRSGSAVLEFLLRQSDKMSSNLSDLGLKELIVTASWYTWWERRKIAREEHVQKPARSAQAILALSLNYYRSCKVNHGIRRHGWEKPREEYVKLNIDASFSPSNFSGATGAVLRDAQGIFIAGSNCGIPHIGDATTAEARALRDGLILADQLGCNRIEVNSDCLEVIDTMRDGGNSIGPAAAIYEECSFLARGFTHVTFNHCPRESNVVARLLACKAEGPHSAVWHEDPPDFIRGQLAIDVTIV
jgi:ribonuclease HI